MILSSSDLKDMGKWFSKSMEYVQAPDELIVASIVDDVDDPGLASSRLGGPCKVASVQPGQKISFIV